MIFIFWMLSFKPAFSLSSFTFIKNSLVSLCFLPLKWYPHDRGCMISNKIWRFVVQMEVTISDLIAKPWNSNSWPCPPPSPGQCRLETFDNLGPISLLYGYQVMGGLVKTLKSNEWTKVTAANKPPSEDWNPCLNDSDFCFSPFKSQRGLWNPANEMMRKKPKPFLGSNSRECGCYVEFALVGDGEWVEEIALLVTLGTSALSRVIGV